MEAARTLLENFNVQLKLFAEICMAIIHYYLDRGVTLRQHFEKKLAAVMKE